MPSIFAGKEILIGVTGSIAAFKVAGWVSELAKEEARVSVVMTEAACKFVGPVTFAALSGNKVHTDMFALEPDEVMAHINLGRQADLIVIAPATANCLAKLAAGAADDLLCTTVLASRAKILICPAMNSRMYSHPATRKNLQTLREYGYTIVSPDSGVMACKEEGEGRLPEWARAREHIAKALSRQDLAGKKVLVTAGPTREPLDPARFLSNRSSGKMGYAFAQAAFRRGADVLLVSGPTTLACPEGIRRIMVQTAQEMYNAVFAAGDSEIVIKAAAVADYRPQECLPHKAKKDTLAKVINLEQNPDILLALGKKKRPGQVLVGFAAESENLEVEGQKKLLKKNLDFIAVNDIRSASTGFEVDTNQILLLSKSGGEQLPHTSKLHAANLILDRIVAHCTHSG